MKSKFRFRVRDVSNVIITNTVKVTGIRSWSHLVIKRRRYRAPLVTTRKYTDLFISCHLIDPRE
jgi:hypothetical protein